MEITRSLQQLHVLSYYICIYFFIGVVYILRNQPRGKRPGFPNDKKCNFNTIAICKTN